MDVSAFGCSGFIFGGNSQYGPRKHQDKRGTSTAETVPVDSRLYGSTARLFRNQEWEANEMIRLNSCPRCHGAVLEYTPPSADSAMCINCGWRRQEVPPDIQEQVQAHLGKAVFEGRYAHTRIGTGKPPLSGWDRVKRSRERARRPSTPPRRWTTGTVPPGATTQWPTSLRLVVPAVAKGRRSDRECQIPPVRYQIAGKWNPAWMSTRLPAMYRGGTCVVSAARYFRVPRRSGWSHP